MSRRNSRVLKTTQMLPDYVGEHVSSNKIWGSAVQYLDEKARVPFRLGFQNGKIYDANGRLFDTVSGSTLHSDGKAIFVMDAAGNIFASRDHHVGLFHHSSLLAGDAVAAAGEIEVENGVLKYISDKSGHYRPKRRFAKQALDQLKEKGIPLQKVKKDFVGG